MQPRVLLVVAILVLLASAREFLGVGAGVSMRAGLGTLP